MFIPTLPPMKRLMNDLNKPMLLASGRIMFRGKIFGAKEITEIREWLKMLTFRDIDSPEQIDEQTDIDCLRVAFIEIGKDINELYLLATDYSTPNIYKSNTQELVNALS